MPRRPDALCAGGCGKLIWGGRGSLPAGQRMCRSCRKPAPANCAVCQATTKGGDATCSRVCAYKLRVLRREEKLVPCVDCSEATPNQTGPFGARCPACALELRRARQRRRDTKRRGGPRRLGARVTMRWLGSRDGWTCHLCRKRVDPAKRWPDPKCASADHLVPVSHGGSDEPENLALSHLDCNVNRGNRGDVQLLLFG
jgi:hypothetical protein